MSYYSQMVKSKFPVPPGFEEATFEQLRAGDVLFDRTNLTPVTVISKEFIDRPVEPYEMVSYKCCDITLECHLCWFVQR